MTAYIKPQVRGHVWGETATNNDLVDPGDTYASAGWQQGVKPPRQYVNWVLNYTFEGIRYLCQQGVAQWDATETYQVGAITQGPDTYLYKSRSINSGHTPSDVAGGMPGPFWDSPAVPTPANGDVSVRAANTLFISNNYMAKNSPFSALSGSIQNGQVPVGAVTQWQGSLVIAGSQLNSPVDKSNKILINGDYRLLQWAGQNGQPTWLFGSSDGVNFFVWNPSNFSVSNSANLGGLAPSQGPVGSTIAQRTPEGYLEATYFYQGSGNNENSTISQVMVTNGGDGFLRKASLAFLAATINPTDTASAQKTSVLPGGIIIKAGTISGAPYINVPVDVALNFTQPFPNVCAGVFPCTNRNVGANGQAANGSNFASNISRTGCIVTIDATAGSWFAIGY